MKKENNYKEKVFSGLIWTFGERVIAQGVSFILSIILARLLLPKDYGVIALILVFINIADVFVNNGFGEALIQDRDSDEKDFSTIFYCSFITGCILYFILFYFSSFIAKYYDALILEKLIKVLALKIPISAISTIQHAYVSKKLIFKKFFFSTITGTIISGVVGVYLAYLNFGAWALVCQYLLNTSIDTLVLFFTIPWRPKLIFSFLSAKRLISYSWKITMSSLINTLYGELKNFVIGSKYTTSDLAFYNRGNQFPSLIITNIDVSIGKVTFPVMANLNDNINRLKLVSRKILKMTSYLIFPLMIGLMIVSKQLVILLLTDKWLESVAFLKLGCIFYIFQPIQTANWQIIKALGRSDLCFKLEIIKKIIGIGLILGVMNLGVYYIALAAVISGFISMLINMYPNKKLIGYSIKEQIIDLSPALLLSIIMGIGVSGLEYFIQGNILLLYQIVLGIVIYIVLSFLFKVDSFFYLINFFQEKFLKRGK